MSAGLHVHSFPECQTDIFYFAALECPFRPHFHEWIMAGCLLAGRRKFRTCSGEQIIRPGEVALLPPNAAHGCDPVDECPATWVSVHVKPDSGRIMPAQGIILKNSDAQDIAELLAMAGTATRPEITLARELAATVRQAVSLLQANTSLSSAAIEVRETRTGLDELALSAGMKKFSYLRSFRQATGITPGRCEANMRLNNAQKLLQAGDAIAASASAWGFCDQAHFSRIFRENLGITPGQYRQAWRP